MTKNQTDKLMEGLYFAPGEELILLHYDKNNHPVIESSSGRIGVSLDELKELDIAPLVHGGIKRMLEYEKEPARVSILEKALRLIPKPEKGDLYLFPSGRRLTINFIESKPDSQ